MYIFVDESGKFESQLQSDFGVMVIVTISDKAYEDCKSFFTSTSSFGINAYEIKANSLDVSEREIFLKYIGRHPEIKYSAFVYDHKATSSDAISLHQQKQVKKVEEGIERIRRIATYPSLITDLELLRNQLRKLSLADYLKVISLIESLREWARTFSFDYFYMDITRDNWDIHHIFDMQNQASTFVRLVYALLSMSSNELTPNVEPIQLPADWTGSHPFLKKYNLPQGVDMKSFFKNRECKDDKVEIGLKLPDLISNTIFRSIQRQADKKWLKLLKRIWPNRSFIHAQHGQVDYYKVVTFPSSEGNVMMSEKIINHFHAMKFLKE